VNIEVMFRGEGCLEDASGQTDEESRCLLDGDGSVSVDEEQEPDWSRAQVLPWWWWCARWVNLLMPPTRSCARDQTMYSLVPNCRSF